MEDDLKDEFQKIADINVGKAMQAFELAGIDNPALKHRIKKLIYFTAEDVIKQTAEGKKDEQRA